MKTAFGWVVVSLAFGASGCSRERDAANEAGNTAVTTQNAERPAEPKASAVERPIVAPPTTASASAASSDTRSDAGHGGDSCTDLCRRSRELRCPNADGCAVACRNMLREAICANELSLAFRCFSAQEKERWECGEDGLATIKEGTCDAEQERYLHCAARAAGHE